MPMGKIPTHIIDIHTIIRYYLYMITFSEPINALESLIDF